MKILYGFIVIDVDYQRFEPITYHSTRTDKGKGYEYTSEIINLFALELPFAPVCI